MIKKAWPKRSGFFVNQTRGASIRPKNSPVNASKSQSANHFPNQFHSQRNIQRT